MFGPGHHTESQAIVGYLGAQLDGIRTAAYGLDDQQARETPCRSTLSIGGLLKHAVYVMEQRLTAPADGVREFDEAAFGRFAGSFALTEDETLAGALERFDQVREAYLADVAAADPGADMVEPAAPWDGVLEPTPSVQRFALLHHIEELARHAGHADIIREQLDGAQAGPLTMAVHGMPDNPFQQAWRPETDPA